jgi:type III secretion system YopN/LcrE/InvE/MxiC family regulator
MSLVPLVSQRTGARGAVRHDIPSPSTHAGDEAKAGHSPSADLTFATSDEMSVFLPLGMRNRRMGTEFDLEHILVDNADFLLDEVEQAGTQLPGEPGDAGESLLELVQQNFVDPSDALMALKVLRKRFALEEHADALDQAEQLLARQVPRRTLLAGANAALSARWHAPACALHASELRTLYRRFVDACPDVLDTYSDWIEQFEASRRTALIEFIRDALVADIDAAAPSCTQDEFAPLAQDLGVLTRLRCADQAFVARLRAAAGQVGWPGDTSLMHDIDLDTPFARLLMDGFSGASTARKVVEWMIEAGCGTNPERARAVMVQGLIAGFRLAPEGLFRCPLEREALLDGLQDELSALAVDERLAGMRSLLRRHG